MTNIPNPSQLRTLARPAPAPLTMPEFRDTCTDPDNCRRCGHGTPTWDQANHEHAGIPIGPQKTKPKDGVGEVEAPKPMILDVGFKFHGGIHTPTVLLGFAPGDFDARDAFVRAMRNASVEGRK